jgi:plastocyanin
VITEPSKVFLRLTPVAIVLAIAYGVLGRDRVGAVLLLMVGLVALVAGLFVLRARDTVLEPSTEADADTELAGGEVPAVAGPAVLGGVAAALGAAAFVYGAPVAIAALLVGAFAGVWWTAADIADARGRAVNLLPVAIPVVVMFVIASIVFFMSRVLLAVNKDASTIIAMLVALLILLGCAAVASRPQLAPSRLVTLLAAAGVVLVASGLVAAAVGERKVEAHAGAQEVGPTAQVTAKALAFVEKTVKLPAGKPVVLRFKNDAAGIPHNVAIAPDDTFAQELFKGDIVVGPISVDYTFTAPAPGTYPFHCDVHPNMKGTVTVA